MHIGGSNVVDEEMEVITITQEDGASEDFEVVTYFEHPVTGIKYVFLVALDQSEEEEQDVYPFRYDEKDGEMVLAPVEDDEEWEMLEEVLDSILLSEEV